VSPTSSLPTNSLPATVALRQWRSVHALGPAGRVLGLDPGSALVVGDLPPALAELLPELRNPTAPESFVDRAVQRGVSATDATTLLEALHDAGELVDAADAGRVAAHRRTCAVVVAGTGPLSVALVLGLVAGGVGAVHLRTTGLVGGGDLGTGLFDDDRGLPRLGAVRGAVRRLAPLATVTAPPRTLTPDLVVLADEAPDPGVLAELVAERTAHLPVRLRDGVGVVGPLVLPGRTACLTCLDLQRGALDPGWPMIAAQLVGQRGAADPACVAATAAFGTAQALAALDGTTGGTSAPATLEATVEIDPTSGAVEHRRWAAMPECGCSAALPVPGGSPERSGGPGATIEA
jgi:bacteriocin biosynthesis cyclodehydratase domain-containing protein